jgi:hypothetical protein
MSNQPATTTFDEAPASWNTRYLDTNGFECQITLRGENGTALLEKASSAIAFLMSNGCIPYVYRSSVGRKDNGASEALEVKPDSKKANGNGNSAWCPIHQIEMKRWDKDGRVWFSHKVDGGWCKGK